MISWEKEKHSDAFGQKVNLTDDNCPLLMKKRGTGVIPAGTSHRNKVRHPSFKALLTAFFPAPYLKAGHKYQCRSHQPFQSSAASRSTSGQHHLQEGISCFFTFLSSVNPSLDFFIAASSCQRLFSGERMISLYTSAVCRAILSQE